MTNFIKLSEIKKTELRNVTGGGLSLTDPVLDYGVIYPEYGINCLDYGVIYPEYGVNCLDYGVVYPDYGIPTTDKPY